MPESTKQLEAASSAAYGMGDACAQAALRLVELAGHPIACRRGCNTCCDSLVSVTLAEAMPVALWLSEPERKPRLDSFREQMRARRDSLGGEMAALEEAIQRADNSAADDSAFEQFIAAAQAYRRRRLACPFNVDVRGCEIYPIRPLLCRVYWVAGSSENCAQDGPSVPVVVQHTALSEVIGLARAILNGASAEAGSNWRKPLPEAVECALAWLGEEGAS